MGLRPVLKSQTILKALETSFMIDEVQGWVFIRTNVIIEATNQGGGLRTMRGASGAVEVLPEIPVHGEQVPAPGVASRGLGQAGI